MPTPAAPYLLPLLGSLLLCYAAGHLALAPIDQRGWHAPVALFRKLAVGVALLAMGYALGMTAGRSVSLVTLGVLLAGFFAARPATGNFKTNMLRLEWRELALVCLAGVLFFALQAAATARCGIHPDCSFYAGVAECMQRTGVETSVMDWVNPDLQSPIPYHYGQMWLAGAVGRVWGITILYALMMVVFPLTMTLFYAGMAALARQRLTQSRYGGYALALIVPCLVVGEVLLSNSFEFFSLQFYGARSLFTMKYLPVYIAFAVAVTCEGRSLFWRSVPLCALAGLFATAGYIFFVGLPLAALAALFVRRTRRDGLYALALVGGSALVTVTFYVLSWKPAVYALYGLPEYKVILDMGLGEPLQVGASALKKVFNLALNFAPGALLVWLLGRAQRDELRGQLRADAPLVAGVLAAGLVISAMGWAVIDSVQLWNMMMMPLTTIFTFAVAGWCVMRLRGWRKAVPLLLIGVHLLLTDKLPVYSRPDGAFLGRAETLRRKGGNFAFVESGLQLAGLNPYYRNANFVRAFSDLRLVTDDYLPADLSVYDIPYQRNDLIERAYVVSSIERSPFYLWVEKNGLQSDLSAAQNRFIVENDVRYLVVRRGLKWLEGRPFKVLDVVSPPGEPYDLYVIAPAP